MSIEAIAWAFKRVKIDDPITKLVLIAVCNYANDENQSWPYINTLCDITSLSRRTIQSHLRKLEELRLITGQPRQKPDGTDTSTMYTVNVMEGAPNAPYPPAPPAQSGRTGRAVGAQDMRGEGAPPAHLIEPSFNQDIEPLVEPNASATRLVTAADWPADYADVFWSRYPNKKSKGHALKALDKIYKAGKTRFVDLINGLERYKLSRDVQRGFVKHPATWLNGQCWTDQEQTTPVPVERPQSFFELAEESWSRAKAYEAGSDPYEQPTD